MANYTRMAATAKRLIEKNGRTVTLVRLSRSALDTNKPWRGPDPDPDPAPAAITCKAVIVPYEAKELEGSLIRNGDKRAFIADTSLPDHDLEKFDTLIDGGDTYKIVSVALFNPGDVRLLYEIQLRR